MSLHPDADPSVPDDTAAVAHAVFPRGTACLRLRDRLGPIFADEQFADLFPKSGQPAECPWRLALVTLLQFGENLSDRRAADAVRSRIDWKYLLGLPLSDPGFDASVLSEFRSRLVKGGAESLLFDRLLVLCREQGFLAQHGRQRTDSTHVLGAVRTLTRLACAIETLRAALEALAVAAPDWLRAHADKAWAERYERRGGDVHTPKGDAARRAFAETVGRDGETLLSAVTASGAPAWLREVPAVEVLRRVWVQNFCRLDDDAGPSAPDKPQVLRWRTEVEGYPPSALMVASPHDLDVHYAKKRATTWIGYKVHLTETCEAGQPNLITHVETTTACQRRSDSRPAGRSKRRPVRVSQRHGKGPDRGPFHVAVRFGSADDDVAGVAVDDLGGGLVLLRPGRCPAAADGLLEAVAVAVHGQDADVMGEPVEQGAGETLRSEDRCPVLERKVRCDDGRTPLVTLRECLEEQFGSARRERHVAKLVDDQQLHGLQVALELEKTPFITSLRQLVHQGRRSGERNGEALLAGGQPQGQGDMGLAGAAVAECDDVLPAQDELAAPQLQHQHLVEARDGGEVEGVEALHCREPGGTDTALDDAALAVEEFQLQQAEQVAGMIDAALSALARHLVVFAQDRRQFQLLEVVAQKHLGSTGPGAARHGAVDGGRHAAISGTSTA